MNLYGYLCILKLTKISSSLNPKEKSQRREVTNHHVLCNHEFWNIQLPWKKNLGYTLTIKTHVLQWKGLLVIRQLLLLRPLILYTIMPILFTHYLHKKCIQCSSPSWAEKWYLITQCTRDFLVGPGYILQITTKKCYSHLTTVSIPSPWEQIYQKH